jgi:hypothetical protein
MKNQATHYSKGVFTDDLSHILPFVNIFLCIIVIYAIVRLYRKILFFLDENS